MTILDTLKTEKTHIIYSIIILSVIGVGVAFFKAHPKEIIKTQTVTQVVTKVVTKTVVQTKVIHDHITTTKNIVTTKPDGTKIVETDVTKNNSIDNFTTNTHLTKDSTKSLTQKTTIDVKYQSDFMVTVLQPVTFSQVLSGTPDYSQTEIIGGVRLWGFPVFLNVGIAPMAGKVFIGATYEW